MSKYGRCRGWTRDGRIGLMVLVGVTWNITGQEFDKAWFWKVLWLDDMAVRCADKNRNVFFDLYPWTSRIQTGKKHGSHYLDLCNVWCLWVIMNHIFCLLPGLWMEGDARVFSNRTGFSKEMSCEKNIHKVKHQVRYIIDPSSEMLWARIQYSSYLPGIYWYYSIYSMSCQILSDQSKNFRQMREASPARLTLVQNVRDVRNNSLINSFLNGGNHGKSWFNMI